jgi:SAM-dependent methyltransferase
MIPDWQLPAGVDRGLHDYMNSEEMVSRYDAGMAVSPLSRTDEDFCRSAFPEVGRLLDLGCGTGRLTAAFAPRGYDCVGIDLSEPMLEAARQRPENAAVRFVLGNLVDLEELVSPGFDYAACLFSTFGMIRGEKYRARFLSAVASRLKPGGVFVLHAHNRWYRGVPWSWRSLRTGEFTMPQAYGGAPLTLRHFGWPELKRLIRDSGFSLEKALSLTVLSHEPLTAPGLLGRVRAYGYLLQCRKG